MPSFILIRPTVWPRYTNVTDRQDRQRSDSMGRTVFSERELYAVAHPSICLSSVMLVHPTQAVVNFGNFSMAFGTLAIR